MSVALGAELIVKGAPDAVLPHVTGLVAGAAGVVDDMAGRGLRVLVVAFRGIDAGEQLDERAEAGLELLGLLGLEDPPRPEARAAVEACRAAGIPNQRRDQGCRASLAHDRDDLDQAPRAGGRTVWALQLTRIADPRDLGKGRRS